MMAESPLQTQEHAYRDASRGFDYFVTGLSALLFLSTALFFEVGQRSLVSALDVAAIVLFALAVVAGLKKLEYYVAVLGTNYSIALTEANQTNLTVRESTAVLRDLNDTIERLSSRASIVHSLRNWMLLLGVLAVTGSRILDVFSIF